VERNEVARDSAEYAEIIAEVFVETVVKATNSAMYCEYDQEEITPSLMHCLHYLYLHGPDSVRDIAAGLEISLSAASQLVDRLVKKGLVTRKENEDDRRLTSVELASAGSVLVEQMRERRSKWFESIIDQMPEAKRCALLDGLEGFLKVSLAHEVNIDRACVKCGMVHVPFCVVNKVKNERAGA